MYNPQMYVDRLNSKEERDKAFCEQFLQEYMVLFDDIDAVKKYLKDHVTDTPYHWMGNKEVVARIKAMAKAKYVQFGYSKAKSIIDEMPADRVKEYLKKLIEDNISVGIEIMKGHE